MAIEWIFLVVLLVLIAMGVPIAWALAITSIVGLIFSIGFEGAIGLITSTTYNTVSAYLFATIPTFILMAECLGKSGITENIFKAVEVWTSRLRGGLAMATTIANGGMAALSGSSVAAAASMSAIAVPEMRKYGYDDRLSIGTVAAAGTFAIMIPPSLGLILYGVITETSIARLFIAGIIPGLLTVVGYMVTISVWGWINPDVIGESERSEKKSYSWTYKLSVLKPIYPAVILIVLVLGGLYTGAVTPTEAGALGASGAIVLGYLFADLGREEFDNALTDTIRTTTMIFMIIIGAMIFARFLAISGATQIILDTITSLDHNRWTILFVILAIYVLLGTILDQAAILVMTLPLTFPIVVDVLGFNAIWFGVVLVKTAEIGLITPPLGLNIFVATGPVDIDVETAFKGTSRFLVMDVLILIALIAFPSLVLYLPGTM